MENNQIEQESQISEFGNSEPEYSENSGDSKPSEQTADSAQSGGKSVLTDPQTEKLLGKFKSVEDLTNAYTALEKHQGECSEELGSLRKEVSSLNDIKDYLENVNNMQLTFRKCMARDSQKYNTPEYLQDPTFKELYTEALMALGEDLDTDRLVNLVESYVGARIKAYDQKKAAQNETQQVLDSMTYSENPKSSIEKPKKTLDEMSIEEVNEMLDRLV